MVVVNDSSRIGPGKEKRTHCASSASMGGSSPFVGQTLLGPGPLGRPIRAVLMMGGFWGPKILHESFSMCWGKLRKHGCSCRGAEQTPIVLMMLEHRRARYASIISAVGSPFRYSSGFLVAHTYC